MDSRFDVYNMHITAGIDYFCNNDPQLSALRDMPLAYTFPLIEKFPVKNPGIYTLGGGRQIGKSTLLKQWMRSLLREHNVSASQIFFCTGDIIDDYHQLLQILTQVLENFSQETLSYLIIDEISYIKNWDRCIKFLADSGQLRNTVLMLSGSDLIMIQEARMRFPGRRGDADVVDFHLYPLSFREYLQLTEKNLFSEISQEANDIMNIQLDMLINAQQQEIMLTRFNCYLQHGGYLTAINDLERFGFIHPSTLVIYSDWIRGDMLKRNKQETYLKEILLGIIKHYTSQISWNNLAKSLSIEHHKTIADYMDILSHMDAVFVQQALQEDKLTAAPKKAKKVFFTDPFVFHAIYAWIYPEKDPYHTQILPATQDPIRAAQLVETIVVNHFQRHYPTYYIKAAGEIDVAYIAQEKYWPIEIKWRNQIRPKELKQIMKYKNAEIWSKDRMIGNIEGVKTQFLPWALAKI